MQRNKVAVLASTALCMSLGFAQTADAQGRGPIVNSWAGFYVGGNLGYSWGQADTTVAVSPFTYAPLLVDFPGASSSEPAGKSTTGQASSRYSIDSKLIFRSSRDLEIMARSSGLMVLIELGLVAARI